MDYCCFGRPTTSPITFDFKPRLFSFISIYGILSRYVREMAIYFAAVNLVLKFATSLFYRPRLVHAVFRSLEPSVVVCSVLLSLIFGRNGSLAFNLILLTLLML